MELIILIALILVGALLTRLHLLNTARISWANKWIIYIALPAVALAKIPRLTMGLEMLAPVLSAFIIFLGSALVFMVLLKDKFNHDQRIALTIISGLGNTSFIGFPLINFYFGSDYLPIAVIFDQGSFFLLATAVQYLITTRDGAFNAANSAKRILTFPPFIGLIIALIIPADFIDGFLFDALNGLGQTISPVAMIVVGFQIARFVNFEFSKPMIYGLSYKLIVAPILIWGFVTAFGVSEMIFKTSIFEAAMAPMITPAILLSDLNIERKLVAQMLCWGIFISFISSGIVFLML
jgi:malate permease and related proteins